MDQEAAQTRAEQKLHVVDCALPLRRTGVVLERHTVLAFGFNGSHGDQLSGP